MRTPSKAQMQAIIHQKGPALICAGPGSGKTFTIILRIQYLINQYHVRPDKILVITYTKAAANEMKARLEAANIYAGVHFGTFHSICFNILRQSTTLNSLIKENDKRRLFQIILDNQGLSSKSGYDDVTLLQNIISRWKNLSIEEETSHGLLEEYCANTEFSTEEIIAFREEYDRFLREQGMLDFDDMVLQCLKLLKSNPVLCRKYQQMFEYILADEFQDVNQPQYQILKLLSAPENNLFVVGDDDQAIYGFRGASPGIMQQFRADFPESKKIMLTENYRSGKEIVELAEQMISRNKERFEKEFYPVNKGGSIVVCCFETRKEEEQRLTEELSSLETGELKDTALIVRTNREVVQYTELLKKSGIAVKGRIVSREDIFHSFIMEDIEAFLSYLYYGNKRCDLLRFMNKPNRFFSRAALPCEEVMSVHMEQYYRNNKAMLSKVRGFFTQLRIARNLCPALAISFFRKTMGYDNYLREKAKDFREFQRTSRQADVLQQCFDAYRIGVPIAEFIRSQSEKTGSVSPESVEVQGVSVLTMHSSKGLEFDRVYLPDINEGVLPSKEIRTPKEHEEERRLLYVAITRARNVLRIYYTRERGRKLSRYLEGLIPRP